MWVPEKRTRYGKVYPGHVGRVLLSTPSTRTQDEVLSFQDSSETSTRSVRSRTAKAPTSGMRTRRLVPISTRPFTMEQDTRKRQERPLWNGIPYKPPYSPKAIGDAGPPFLSEVECRPVWYPSLSALGTDSSPIGPRTLLSRSKTARHYRHL